MEIIHEASSRRRHYRLTVPLTIVYKGKSYNTRDWSLGGFCLEKFEDRELSSGDVIDLSVKIPFQGFIIEAPHKAKIIRADYENGTLACEFAGGHSRADELLQYFSRNLISGEMSAVDNVIKRIDIPVTPPPQPAGAVEWKDQSRGFKIRRIAFTSAYILLGIFVSIYLLVTVYAYFFRLKTDNAVVVIPRKSIAAPVGGTIKDILVSPRQQVKSGQPIICIDDIDRMRLVDLAKMQLSQAQKNLNLKNTQLAAYDNKAKLYRNVTEARLRGLKQKIFGWEKETALARTDYERQMKLQSGNAAAMNQVELAQSRYERLRKELEIAVEEQEVQRQTLDFLDRGLFFSGTKIEHDRNELQNELQMAGEELKLRQDELASALERYKPVTITAPFNGLILEIIPHRGEVLDKGNLLFRIQQDSMASVEVFLSQKEAARIGCGSEAVVFIPFLKTFRKATVSGVDLSGGPPQVLDYLPKERPLGGALVSLTFAVPDDLKNLVAGVPVEVNFKTVSSNRLVAWLQKNIFRE